MLRNFGRKLLVIVPFRGYFAERKEHQKIEKEAKLQLLENEKERIVNAMDDNLSQGNDIRSHLQVFGGNPSNTLRAKQWFQIKQRKVQQLWDEMTDEEVQLEKLERYLMVINENCRPWQNLNDDSKDEVELWLEDANTVTTDLYRYLKEVKSMHKSNVFSKCIRP